MKRSGDDIQFKLLLSNEDGLKKFREMNELFANAFEDEDHYLGHKPSDDYLLSLLKKDHILACVGLVDAQVVAGLVAYVLEKFEQERKEVYIYDLAVDIDHRRKKIGTNLIRFLISESEKLGAWVVYVQADRDDPPAMNLYESLGTREDVYHYDFIVSGSSNQGV